MTKELRSVLKDVLYQELEQIQTHLDTLKPKERFVIVTQPKQL